jgi:small subunit ribosomal protein S11
MTTKDDQSKAPAGAQDITHQPKADSQPKTMPQSTKVESAPANTEAGTPGKKVKKRILRNVPEGEIHIKATYNNTLLTACDLEGNVLAWSSSGASGFKGSRKPTPYASSVAATNLASKLKNFGFSKARIYINGTGSGREQSVRALQANGISVISLHDVTPIAHTGCRAKKPRRV